ncbi:uncharacterized protein LOC126788967 [Argentina anserina]|uniref:uncharacterized protein LOC126788967 n=1 Tax=Argentina anserina TaxID=57926 RepID=UPI0021767603|nr:uncharacterized protein LOC126788967 [Potentilla anserina]
MGNCMRHEESSSSVNWGGEDWGSLANDDRDHKHMRKTKVVVEEEGLLGGEDGGEFGSYDSSKTKIPLPGASEVKIKMTKKQLEELMGRMELKEMTVQQVLAQLIISVSSSADPYETDHQRPWRPVLQSIPEVN